MNRPAASCVEAGMHRLLLALALLAACGGGRSSSGSTVVVGGATAAPDAAPPHGDLAGAGEVCAAGDRDPDAVARPCAAGLSCCYGCGIPGCNSVCMDVTEYGGCPEYP